MDAISALNIPDHGVNPGGTSLADISKMLLTIQTEVNETQLHHRVLRQLIFKDMNSRANQIHKSAQDTYKWMLEDGTVQCQDERSRAWHAFVGWLRSGDNIFFISGNPGSGKSTLMKFLSQHERTKEELAVWAGANTLIFGVFYFWNSGSPTQRTLSGFYRSILFQSLSQRPELLEQVFPLTIRRMRASPGNMIMEEIQGIDEEQIEEAFNLLLDRTSQGGYRLCFFIDGLDECEGNRLKHEELTLKLQRWTVSGTIKLCVSSRPYSEFVGPLSIPENPTIQLHELNESDIRAYCIGRFENDIYARERSKLCQDLAISVVRQAQGVFLWVYLVIDILLTGLRQANSDSVLLEQLNSMPTDLDRLYTKLREPIEADRIQRDISNRMLLLAAHNPGNEDLPAISFSWLEDQGCGQGGLMDPNFPPHKDLKPYSDEEISHRIERVTRQIDGLARGFLEVTPCLRLSLTEKRKAFFASAVQFCHRTARDYLLHNENRHLHLLKSFPNFERSSIYARILLAELIYGYKSQDIMHFNVFFSLDPSLCSDMDPDLAGKFELLIQRLLNPFHYRLSLGARSGRWVGPQDQVSFLEFAAFNGLSRFVLRQLTTVGPKLNGTSSSCNVIFAAVMNRRFDLASQLLNLNRGDKDLCEVCDEHGNVKSLVPACVLAIAEALWSMVRGEGETFISSVKIPWLLDKGVELGKQLLNLSIKLEISLRITVVSIRRIHYGEAAYRDSETKVRIDAAEAVKLLDELKLPPGTVDSRTEVLHARRHILEKMSIERFGQVAEEEVDKTDGLKPWSKMHFFTSEIQSHEIFIDKIEWALEGQELAEVNGWARVY